MNYIRSAGSFLVAGVVVAFGLRAVRSLERHGNGRAMDTSSGHAHVQSGVSSQHRAPTVGSVLRHEPRSREPRTAGMRPMVDDLSRVQRTPAQHAVIARWESETPDPPATHELASILSDAMEDSNVDGSIDDLTCKETLCRVNLHFAGVAHAIDFQKQMTMVERQRKVDFSIAADGIVDVEVFLARE